MDVNGKDSCASTFLESHLHNGLTSPSSLIERRTGRSLRLAHQRGAPIRIRSNSKAGRTAECVFPLMGEPCSCIHSAVDSRTTFSLLRDLDRSSTLCREPERRRAKVLCVGSISGGDCGTSAVLGADRAAAVSGAARREVATVRHL